MLAMLVSGVAVVVAMNCNVTNEHKRDCKQFSEQACLAAQCCWVPEGAGSKTPWCYWQPGMGPPPTPAPPGPKSCDHVNLTSVGGPGFAQQDYDALYQRFVRNININGTGAVVASPDPKMPYYFHWMRDGALSMWNFMRVNNDSYGTVQKQMAAYTAWVAKVQKDSDPNNIDVRVEPKFTIPDAAPYTGGWCRPQTDGPGLRANTLAHWAMILLNNGQQDQVTNTVWPLIQADLEWVSANWQSNGCDLWEEVRSDDFFWNKMAYAASLTKAAALAAKLGNNGAQTAYKATAATIMAATAKHWDADDEYLYESTNRPIDGATIHALTSFGSSDLAYDVMSKEAALTIKHHNRAFCLEFPINQQDNLAGKTGVLYGRYPGDSYMGGNPWQLLTAALAELFYRAANEAKAPIAPEWLDLLGLDSSATVATFSAAAKSAGDSVMVRLARYLGGTGNMGMVSEQIDKHSGTQISANDLTWSYANILHALRVRDQQ